MDAWECWFPASPWWALAQWRVNKLGYFGCASRFNLLLVLSNKTMHHWCKPYRLIDLLVIVFKCHKWGCSIYDKFRVYPIHWRQCASKYAVKHFKTVGKSSDDKKTICCPPGHARIIACKLLISNFAVVEPPALRVKLQPQPTPPRVQVSPSSGSCLQVDAHARLPRSVHPEMAERRLGVFFW